MEKILLIIDAQNFKPQTLDFVAGVSGQSKVVGVLLFNDMLKAIPYIRSVGGQVFVEEITLTDDEIKQRENTIAQCSALFKTECAKRSINAIVHNDNGDPLKQILKESRYADLIIADPTISFSSTDSFPTNFIKELLAGAECPVLIAPESFTQTEEIVFAYDGSKSSMAAIKQFYIHMPKFAAEKVIILNIKDPGSSLEEDATGKALFEEWLKMKFSKYSFVTISGDVRDELFTYFMDREGGNNSLLVIGAFGRGWLSTFFKPSASELVLKAVDIPVFISHL